MANSGFRVGDTVDLGQLAEAVSVESSLEDQLAKLHHEDIQAVERIYAFALRRQGDFLAEVLGLPRREPRYTERKG